MTTSQMTSDLYSQESGNRFIIIFRPMFCMEQWLSFQWLKVTVRPVTKLTSCNAHNKSPQSSNMKGKPKHGPICELMRKTRLHFTYLLKQCQQREDMIWADAMAKSTHANDIVSQWFEY